jgi:hypothetical protein
MRATSYVWLIGIVLALTMALVISCGGDDDDDDDDDDDSSSTGDDDDSSGAGDCDYVMSEWYEGCDYRVNRGGNYYDLPGAITECEGGDERFNCVYDCYFTEDSGDITNTRSCSAWRTCACNVCEMCFS